MDTILDRFRRFIVFLLLMSTAQLYSQIVFNSEQCYSSISYLNLKKQDDKFIVDNEMHIAPLETSAKLPEVLIDSCSILNKNIGFKLSILDRDSILKNETANFMVYQLRRKDSEFDIVQSQEFRVDDFKYIEIEDFRELIICISIESYVFAVEFK